MLSDPDLKHLPPGSPGENWTAMAPGEGNGPRHSAEPRRGEERRGEEKVVTLSSTNSKFYVAVTNERDGRTDFLPCRESWFVWERKEGSEE